MFWAVDSKSLFHYFQVFSDADAEIDELCYEVEAGFEEISPHVDARVIGKEVLKAYAD